MRGNDILKNINSVSHKFFFVIFLSVVFSLYLAPSPAKVLTANIVLVLILGMMAPFFNCFPGNLINILKFLTPVIVLLCYTVFLSFENQSYGYWYSIDLLKGTIVCISFFFIFTSSFVLANRRWLVPFVFFVPGVVHLLVLVVDVVDTVLRGGFIFYGDGYGYLEFFKRIPRVGSRYVSYAMMHMICGSILLICYGFNKVLVRLGIALFFLGVIVLALMDARAAFFSIFVGLAGAVLVSPALRCRISVLFSKKKWKIYFAIFVGLVLLILVSSGFSRWERFSYSVAAASNDVFYSNIDISSRPFVDKNYWDETPVIFDSKGDLIHNFRSDVDQSAYLRFAWFFSGFKLLFENPWGVGASDKYMSKAWGLDGAGVNSTVDSFFTEMLVSFGLVGFFVCVLAVYMVVREYRRKVDDEDYWVFLFLLIASAARSIFDPIDGGYELYLFACVGIFYGLIGGVKFGLDRR